MNLPKPDRELHVQGRGHVFVYNDFSADDFARGDTISVEGADWRITGIEYFSTLMSRPTPKPGVGLIVRPADTTLRTLARRIREVNDANAFEKPTWETLPTKLMFVITEFDEAVAAVHGTGPDPLAEELADAAIRLIDVLESVWPGDWANRVVPIPATEPCLERIEVLVWEPVRYVCMATEVWRYEKQSDARIALELAVKETFALADKLQIDLMAEIQAKTRRNAERGRLHGKARAEG